MLKRLHQLLTLFYIDLKPYIYIFIYIPNIKLWFLSWLLFPCYYFFFFTSISSSTSMLSSIAVAAAEGLASPWLSEAADGWFAPEELATTFIWGWEREISWTSGRPMSWTRWGWTRTNSWITWRLLLTSSWMRSGRAGRSSRSRSGGVTRCEGSSVRTSQLLSRAAGETGATEITCLFKYICILIYY